MTSPDFVDLHSHVLPGLDDGAADVTAGVDLVCRLEELGFREFYPTPHHKANTYHPEEEETRRARDHLQEALTRTPSRAIIHPAAGENMWDELFLERREGGLPTYPGGKAFLIEFPDAALPAAAVDTLFQFRLTGRLPVIAHVERYPRDLKDPRRAEAIARVAALLVNLSALAGADGWASKRLARGLVKAGLVHAVASDAHHVDDIPAIAAGVSWLRHALGEQAVQRLLCDGPQRIVAGELPEW